MFNWRLCLIVSSAALAGCQGFSLPATADGAGAALESCPRQAVVEDGEDRNNQVLDHQGRNGYLYTFSDDKGTTVSPEAGARGGTFAMSLGGANGSAFSARFKGKVNGSSDPAYAGLGVNFVDPKGPYDASSYSGISFYARRGANSVAKIRLKLPDANTTPEAKRCDECFNDFGTDLNLTTHWTRYNVRFKQLKQLVGWGSPRPTTLDNGKIYALQWQVDGAGADFDIWIDDIVFSGCKQ